MLPGQAISDTLYQWSGKHVRVGTSVGLRYPQYLLDVQQPGQSGVLANGQDALPCVT